MGRSCLLATCHVGVTVLWSNVHCRTGVDLNDYHSTDLLEYNRVALHIRIPSMVTRISIQGSEQQESIAALISSNQQSLCTQRIESWRRLKHRLNFGACTCMIDLADGE